MEDDSLEVCDELRNVSEGDSVSLIVKDFDESEDEMTLDAECYKINTHSHMGEHGSTDETELWFLIKSPHNTEKRECTVSVVDGHTTFQTQEDPYPNQSPLYDETEGDKLGHVAGVSPQ